MSSPSFIPFEYFVSQGWATPSGLWLPGHPLFQDVLGRQLPETQPSDTSSPMFWANPERGGVLEQVDQRGLDELINDVLPVE